MVLLGFTTTYAITAYHHWCCEFESWSGRGVQQYVIKFVSDLRQVCGFLWVLRFPPLIKLTATIYLKYCQTPLNKQTNKQNIVIILHMCVTMRQTTLTHSYHLIHVCHNDTKYFDTSYHLIHVCHNDAKYLGTLLSSYTCVSQWHQEHWHIVIILYLFVTILLSYYTCVSQWH